MIGFFLLILAWLLLLPTTLINVVLVASKSGTRGWVKVLGGYFQSTARNLDIFGANEFRTLWNTILIQKNGVKFQGDNRTISFYLGANQANNSLSKFGKLIAFICDLLDENHCQRAFEIEQQKFS